MFFNSRRSTVHATNGMVATSQPLAAMAGLRILMAGGNAVDAAVATAATLNVVEPMSTGVGGDLFALIWTAADKGVTALNGSGRAPAAASIDDLRAKGHRRMPAFGPLSISVPGTVHGWETILAGQGTMTLAEVLEPAIRYAEHGFPVSDIIAFQWQQQEGKLAALPSGQELLHNGRAPREGELMLMPDLAKTLRSVAEGGSQAFYRGPIATAIADFVQERGGWLTEDDLAEHHSDWDEAIKTDYRGVTCWECPPNGQGIIALEALNIAEGFDIAAMGPQSADRYHYLAEATRLGFADAFEYLADPRSVEVPTAAWASKAYAAERRQLIDPQRAMMTAPYGKMVPGSDTVYISVIDGDGNACSFINSVFANFGSGLVVPGTGIVMHNRASLFQVNPEHPNSLAGRKRPFHTIIPAMATRDGELWLSYGVMGGFMQPQGHLQVISNMVDFDMDSQTALDALRFQVVGDELWLEGDVDNYVVEELHRRGHRVNVMHGPQRGGAGGMGGGQIISRNPETGVLSGGSEPRKDGAAVGW
jgi:gamma-glutamyltranspeptidase/glutathione hydrolase